MVKNLRSFIHEKFPIELRVQLDIISRRRDIKGPEKVEEIFKAFKEYHVGDVAKLGPGTNRYGCKLDGFVVKVATDNDGKIDNLKEFKMAKRLFPYVPKTYEVSKNGSILIAEYIQPFDSYSEMLRYADQIKEILQKLSSVFLIGDVGITSKNYANWGIRPGTDEVVCLDFAYVYDVSSEIFICRHCKTNSMLVPNKDFTKLICSNPACGKETLFEDIRAMIPNEYHRQQIGDLTEEGYPMTSSNVITELTEERSNYLVKKTAKRTKKNMNGNPHKITYEDNLNDSQDDEIKEENTMRENKIITNARAVAAAYDKTMYDGIVLNATAVNGEAVEGTNPAEEAPTSTLVFSGPINPNISVPNENQTVDDSLNPADMMRVLATPGKAIIKPLDNYSEEVNKAIGEAFTGAAVAPEDHSQDNGFHDSFIENSNKALSTVSNRICDELRSRSVFDEVRNYMADKKLYPETFYNVLGNAIFRSLAEFMQFQETNVPNPRSNGTHREFRAVPEIVNAADYRALRSLRFIERVFNTRAINELEDHIDMLYACEQMYGEAGIDNEWLSYFEQRFSSKIKCVPAAISILKKMIAEIWCLDNENSEPGDEDLVEHSIPVMEVGVKNKNDRVVNENAIDLSQSSAPLPDITGSYAMSEPAEPEATEEEEEVEYEDEDEEENDTEFNPSYLSVRIWHQGAGEDDVIHIDCDDPFDHVTIPIYADLAKYTPDEISKIPALVANTNGPWDWLNVMGPDIMFETDDPDKYFPINNQDPDENQAHVVLMKMDMEHNKYVMGVYMVDGIYVMDEDDNEETVAIPNFSPDLLFALNAAIISNIGNTAVSHLHRSLSMTELIHDESYINQFIQTVDDEDDEDDEDEEETEEAVEEIVEDEEASREEPEATEEEEEEFDATETEEVVEETKEADPVISDAEAAALAVMMNGGTVTETEEPVAVEKVVRNRDAKGRFVKQDNTDSGTLQPVRRKK